MKNKQRRAMWARIRGHAIPLAAAGTVSGAYAVGAKKVLRDANRAYDLTRRRSLRDMFDSAKAMNKIRGGIAKRHPKMRNIEIKWGQIDRYMPAMPKLRKTVAFFKNKYRHDVPNPRARRILNISKIPKVPTITTTEVGGLAHELGHAVSKFRKAGHVGKMLSKTGLIAAGLQPAIAESKMSQKNKRRAHLITGFAPAVGLAAHLAEEVNASRLGDRFLRAAKIPVHTRYRGNLLNVFGFASHAAKYSVYPVAAAATATAYLIKNRKRKKK